MQHIPIPPPPPQCPACRQQPLHVTTVPRRPGTKRVECVRCGTFIVSGSAEAWLRGDEFNERRHLLSGVLRQAFVSGVVREVTTDSVEKFLAQAPASRSVPRLLDDLLLHIYGMSRRFLQIDTMFAVRPHQDYPLFFLRSGGEVEMLLAELSKRGLIERRGSDPDKGESYGRLTFAGWERAEALSSVRGRPDQAFVAMWFDDSMTPTYTEGIKPALLDVGYTPIRIDAVHHSDGVDDRILSEIRRSGLLVADFTRQREGVYFEAGFALGLGIPVVWCCRKDEVKRLHFDTRQYSHILWTSPDDLRTQIRDRIGGLGLARSAGVPVAESAGN